MTAIIGTTLNRRYRVDEALGRGGMADVYKVWDEDRLTYLALKLLRDDLSQDLVFMRRFRREAQNLAQLQHPNIVRFFGLEEEDLQAFILMEFIDGPSLREEIRRAGGNDLILQDAAVSRQHALLRFVDGRWMIQDRNSTGGLFVNDQRVRQQWLKEGDRIRIGSSVFIFSTK